MASSVSTIPTNDDDQRQERYTNTTLNRGQLKDPDISGALDTLRIQYYYSQTQCEDGARDVRVFLIDSRSSSILRWLRVYFVGF